MQQFLRKVIAGPRQPHEEAKLDLCYVTDFLIATSGPSSKYPQRAYRNPVDLLVRFLDSKHGDNWAIFEFRAEGTGYPDAEVYNRIWHYPWPDHHPPPFKLIPLMMASMRDWLHPPKGAGHNDTRSVGTEVDTGKGSGRVIVVHCKAGKGRSGTAATSYLMSEEGWTKEAALRQFTERRMRPGFGAGVSIPSQIRYVDYVERWVENGKIYVEQEVEVVEVQVWGLRDGVKIAIEGYVDEGKTIKTFHVFKETERVTSDGSSSRTPSRNASLRKPQTVRTGPGDHSTITSASSSTSNLSTTTTRKVIYRPTNPVVIPSNDINIATERQSNATYGFGMTTAIAHVWFNAFFEGNGPENFTRAKLEHKLRHDDSAKALVPGAPWAASNGMYEIEWDAMDGIKGSRRKGVQAFEKIAVVWQTTSSAPPLLASTQPETNSSYTPVTDTHGSHHDAVIITEPLPGDHIPDVRPTPWEGPRVPPDQDTVSGTRLADAPSRTQRGPGSDVEGQYLVEDADSDEDGVQGIRRGIMEAN